MCQYTVTGYSCGHEVLHDSKECETKRNAGPFVPILSCQYTEVVRHVHEVCLTCKAEGKEARDKARLVRLAATDKTDTSPSLIDKIRKQGERVFGEHRGTFVPLPAPTVVCVGGRHVRPGPPNQANKRRPAGQRQSKGKATYDIPTIFITEMDESEPRVKTQYSWATGDDLRWQQESSEVARPIVPTAPAELASHLDSLPSQALHPLRQNQPNSIVLQQNSRNSLPHPQDCSEIQDSSHQGKTGRKPAHVTEQQRLRRKPLPPRPMERYATELSADNNFPTLRQELPASTSRYLAYSQEYAQVRKATATALLATDAKRHSRTDEQPAELFFHGDYTAGQYDAQTLAALHGGHLSEGPKEVLRTPTVLRTGQQPAHTYYYESAADLFCSPGSSNEAPARTPTVLLSGRPDWTYKIPTVGQIPAHYSTVNALVPAPASAADLKNSHRHAKLSASQENLWDALVSAIPPTPEMKASERAPQLPALPILQPLSVMGKPQIKEEIRMSARISRPGLHDSYIRSRNMNAKATMFELPALAGAKGGLSAQQKQQGQVPRLRRQETLQLQSQPACAWDEIILQACASRDTLSTTQS